MLQRPIRPGKTGVLIVSPTRELAAQIAVEAEALCKFRNYGIQVYPRGPPLAEGFGFS